MLAGRTGTRPNGRRVELPARYLILLMPFGLFFWIYLAGYPLLVLWTVLRGRGAVQILAIAAALFGVPFYAWAAWKIVGPKPSGDLSGILILFIGPWFMLVQGILTFVVFFQENRSRTPDQDS